MRWVRRYISHFNGDPDRVFIFGQSAGAASVSLHLVMENSWQFFQSAGMESGSFPFWEAQRLKDAHEQFELLKLATACLTVQCLLAMPADKLVKASLGLPPIGRHCQFAPTVDGVELKELPSRLLSEGRFRPNTAVLQGFNRNEGTIDVSSLDIHPKMTRREAEVFFMLYGLSATERRVLFSLYQNVSKQVAGTSRYYWDITNFFTDFSFACPDIRTASSISRQSGSKVFQYEFDHVPSFKPPYWAGWRNVRGSSGVFHAAEIPFVFNLKKVGSRLFNVSLTRTEREFSDVISSAWIQFARTQTTTSTNVWQPFSRAEAMVSLKAMRPYMFKARYNETPRKARCEFIQSLAVSNKSTLSKMWRQQTDSSKPLF